MPDMDGYSVIAELKKMDNTKDIPVIFITGLKETGDEEKGLQLGASDYITKPFNSSIVKLRVKNQIKIINQMSLIFKKELEEKNTRFKNEFLSKMSHEMLTPLNTIGGMTQMLKISDNTEKFEEYIEKIDFASVKLVKIVRDLLDFSRINDGEIELSDLNFSFSSLIQEVFEKADEEIKAKNHICLYKIDDNIPHQLIGDKRRLFEVIYNLLSNAIKFTPPNGRVDLNAFVVDNINDHVILQIEVSDNGEGISIDKQSNIFDIFEQIDNSHTRSHEGLGIGLSVSKYIVEMMDGNIWVESELGKGSKFIFTCKLQKKW
jgi:signal transduction histidine kinase